MTGSDWGGIYVHIPFCVRKCNYCAFLSMVQGETVRAEYVSDLIKEIEIRGRDWGHKCFDTVYLGGGTPSVLSGDQIEAILDAIRSNFNIMDEAEITLEANPGTLGDEKTASAALAGYRRMGINRLSMGVQSMNDNRLKLIGRIHDTDAVRRDYRLAREAGFHNINLDIIFSIPRMTVDGQTYMAESIEDALEDIRQIAGLGPEHISFYSLQLEEGTVFHDLWKAECLEETSDEEDRETYHRGTELLKELGYERYEISNYARGGLCSRHNSKYWSMNEYVAVGLGASGFVDGTRYRNTAELEDYHKAVSNGLAPSEEVYENTAHDNVSEAVFTGLRRDTGVTYEEVVRFMDNPSGDCCRDFWDYYRDAIEEARSYAEEGYLEINEEGIRLTDKGIDISNSIMAVFV